MLVASLPWEVNSGPCLPLETSVAFRWSRRLPIREEGLRGRDALRRCRLGDAARYRWIKSSLTVALPEPRMERRPRRPVLG